MLRKNPNVCFEFDIDQEVVKGKAPCAWGMKYRSVIGFGKVSFLDDPEAKRGALDVIMSHYTDGSFQYPDEVLSKTVVIKVEIESMTAKSAGY